MQVVQNRPPELVPPNNDGAAYHQSNRKQLLTLLCAVAIFVWLLIVPNVLSSWYSIIEEISNNMVGLEECQTFPVEKQELIST